MRIIFITRSWTFSLYPPNRLFALYPTACLCPQWLISLLGFTLYPPTPHQPISLFTYYPYPFTFHRPFPSPKLSLLCYTASIRIYSLTATPTFSPKEAGFLYIIVEYLFSTLSKNSLEETGPEGILSTFNCEGSVEPRWFYNGSKCANTQES